MSTQEQILILNSVVFETNDSIVSISGLIIRGHMSYETRLEINNTQLNYMVNQLQKQNREYDIYDFISSEEMVDGNILYHADFHKLASRSIDLTYMDNLETIKEIRA